MRTPMPNYYYDAPPDFKPNETVPIEVEMEQPPEGYRYIGMYDHASVAVFMSDKTGDSCDDICIPLPYPRGARVGVQGADCYVSKSGEVDKTWQPQRDWCTVTDVKVVYDGQWVEKVTMRRDG